MTHLYVYCHRDLHPPSEERSDVTANHRGETAHFFEEIKVILNRNHSVIFFLKEKLKPWHVWFSVCIYILGRRRRWCLSVLWVKWYLENCCTGTVIGKLRIWCWRKSGKLALDLRLPYSSSFYVCVLVCDFSLFM